MDGPAGPSATKRRVFPTFPSSAFRTKTASARLAASAPATARPGPTTRLVDCASEAARSTRAVPEERVSAATVAGS
jgi:hypothetical protein